MPRTARPRGGSKDAPVRSPGANEAPTSALCENDASCAPSASARRPSASRQRCTPSRSPAGAQAHRADASGTEPATWRGVGRRRATKTRPRVGVGERLPSSDQTGDAGLATVVGAVPLGPGQRATWMPSERANATRLPSGDQSGFRITCVASTFEPTTQRPAPDVGDRCSPSGDQSGREPASVRRPRGRRRRARRCRCAPPTGTRAASESGDHDGASWELASRQSENAPSVARRPRA